LFCLIYNYDVNINNLSMRETQGENRPHKKRYLIGDAIKLQKKY
jgi:hypothetical protein